MSLSVCVTYQAINLGVCHVVRFLCSDLKENIKVSQMLSWAVVVAVMMGIISGFFLFSRLIVKVRIVVHSMD